MIPRLIHHAEPTDGPTNQPIDWPTDCNDAIERKERCSLRSILISLMDRVRTNATLFVEHSARIKRMLRRTLDTRVVSRLTMTPISPTSSHRRFSTYSSSALLLVVIFFRSTYAPFFNVLSFSIAKISFSVQIRLRFFRRCLSSILPFYPILTYSKYSAIYEYVMNHSSFALPPPSQTYSFHPIRLPLCSFSKFSFFFALSYSQLVPPSYYGVFLVNLPLLMSYSHQELLDRCAA